MPEDIYRAGDIQGFDFAFDAVGKIIDWQSVARKARFADVRLTLSLGMLFTQEGAVRYNARASVKIQKGSTDDDIRRAVYAGVRDYIKRVAVKEYVSRQQEEDEDFDESDVPDSFTDTPPDTVALLSSVVLE